jgi:hypothetical protein
MNLTIGLSSWIIQDEKFPEIEVGSEHRLALEFYAKDGLTPTRGQKALRHVQGATYDIVAVVIGMFEEAWILDCGVRLLRDVDAPNGTRVGDVVGGRVYIGVDPYWYLEEISARPGVPDLWYTVRVDSIQLESTERSKTMHPSGREVWSREAAIDRQYQDITVTRSSADDDGNAEYLLTVTFLSGPGV